MKLRSGVSSQPATVVVVFDTNVLYSQKPFRDSMSWKHLLLYAGKYSETAEFVVPDIAVHERARQEAERIKKSRDAAVKALRAMRRAFDHVGWSYSADPTEEDLRERGMVSREQIFDEMRADLEAAGVRVAPFPHADHHTLVSWSLDGHPPFDSTDKGYRDALIWRTVREIAAAQPPGSTILFVGADKDYTQEHEQPADHPRKTQNPDPGGTAIEETTEPVLHQKLILDLRQVTTNTVTVVSSIEKAIEFLGEPEPSVPVVPWAPPLPRPPRPPAPALPPLPWIEPRPTADELITEAIDAACQRLAGDEIAPHWAAPGDVVADAFSDVENPTFVEVIPDLDSVSTHPAERFEGGTVIGEATVEATVSYDGYVFKSDLYGDHSHWTITDPDWNKHYALVAGELEAELTFQFVLDNEEVDVELTYIEPRRLRTPD